MIIYNPTTGETKTIDPSQASQYGVDSSQPSNPNYFGGDQSSSGGGNQTPDPFNPTGVKFGSQSPSTPSPQPSNQYSPNLLNGILGGLGGVLGGGLSGLLGAESGPLDIPVAMAGASAGSEGGNALADYIRGLFGDQSISAQNTEQAAPGNLISGAAAVPASRLLGVLFHPLQALMEGVRNPMLAANPGTVNIGEAGGALDQLENLINSPIYKGRYLLNPEESNNAFADLNNRVINYLGSTSPMRGAENTFLGQESFPGFTTESGLKGPLLTRNIVSPTNGGPNLLTTDLLTATDLKSGISPFAGYNNNPNQLKISEQMMRDFQSLINKQVYQQVPMAQPLNALYGTGRGIQKFASNTVGPVLGALGGNAAFGPLGIFGGGYFGRTLGTPAINLLGRIPGAIFPYGGGGLGQGLVQGLLSPNNFTNNNQQ